MWTELSDLLAAAVAAKEEATERLQQQMHAASSGEVPLSMADARAVQEERARFEEHKAEESKRLGRERRVLERQAKALLKVPDRKEREEVDGLKAELASLKKEMQVRDARWKMSVERLKKRCATAEEQASELAGEVAYLEKCRVNGWVPPNNYTHRQSQAVSGAVAEAMRAPPQAITSQPHHPLPIAPAGRPSGGSANGQGRMMMATATAAAAATAAAEAALASSQRGGGAGQGPSRPVACAAPIPATPESDGGEGEGDRGADGGRVRRGGRLQPKGIRFEDEASEEMGFAVGREGGGRLDDEALPAQWSYADDEVVASGLRGGGAGGVSGSAASRAPLGRRPFASGAAITGAPLDLEAEHLAQRRDSCITDSEAELLAQAEAEVAAEAAQHARAQAAAHAVHPPMSAAAAPAAQAGVSALPTPTSPAEVLMTNGYFLRVVLDQDEGRPLKEEVHPDGKLERAFRSGRCQIIYPTGTRKEVLPNGVVTVVFSNGDVKQTGVDKRVVYYYAEALTTHVSEPDGTQLYHFPNGQVWFGLA